MSESIKTNQVRVKCDFENIDADFDIYEIRIYNDKKLRGAYILEKFSTTNKICSVFFEYGQKMYIMLDKLEKNEEVLEQYLSTIEDGEYMSYERIASENIKSRILAQLFLNNLGNYENDKYKFNNLTGHLFYYTKEWFKTNKTKKNNVKIDQVIALEISINDALELSLDVKTFTSMRLSQQITFKKKQKPLWKQKKYRLNENNTLTRVFDSKKLDDDDLFIPRQINNRKSRIDFIKFQDINKFKQSKMGVLAIIMEQFKERYSEYIRLELKPMKDYNNFEYTDKKTKKLIERRKNLLMSKDVYIIDTIYNDNSKHLSNLIRDFLNEKYEIKSQTRKKPVKGDYNIRIIHSAKYYREHGVKDEYMAEQNEAIIQHLVLERYEEQLIKNALDVKQIINKIISELLLKADIVSGLVSIVNWNDYGFDNSWTFGLNGKRNIYGVQEEYFCFLTINPNGKMNFETVNHDLLSVDNYNDMKRVFDDANVDGKAIGVVKDDKGNINTIKNTNVFSIPNIEEINNILKRIEQPISRTIVAECIEKAAEGLVDNETEEYKQLIERVRYHNKRVIPREWIRKNARINNKNNRKFRIKISNEIEKETGFTLNSQLKNKDARDLYLAACLDIKYKEYDSYAKYFVGERSKGLNTINTSSVMRRIDTHDQSKLFFGKLIELMNVDFVKSGQLTVIPFPFKYLREYMKFIS